MTTQPVPLQHQPNQAANAALAPVVIPATNPPQVAPRTLVQPDEKEILKLAFEAWKVTVGVQQHFNDLCMRVRNYALTLITAVLTAAAFAIKEKVTAHLFGTDVPAASLILAGGLVAWLGFYFMDRGWYHMLLVGSVKHGSLVEKSLSQVLPECGLSGAIGKASPIALPFRCSLHSSGKLHAFYAIGGSLLFVASLVTYFSPAKPSSGAANTTNLTIDTTDAKATKVTLVVPSSNKGEPPQADLDKGEPPQADLDKGEPPQADLDKGEPPQPSPDNTPTFATPKIDPAKTDPPKPDLDKSALPEPTKPNPTEPIPGKR